MITEQDLIEAIAECQGERNPKANTCIKLAAYYTILNHFQGQEQTESTPTPTYSYAPAPVEQVETTIDYLSDTEFSKAINGKQADKVWEVMDDVMLHLQMMLPLMYDKILREIDEI